MHYRVQHSVSCKTLLVCHKYPLRVRGVGGAKMVGQIRAELASTLELLLA